MNWRPIKKHTPPEKQLVQTKVHDSQGLRNEQPLYRDGNLWFVPDGTMYVYYSPTHWKPLEESSK